ncbi:hypothetical protein [Tindallia californiensis]|nr:hypothetical protein [Tindallia californiensis]
MNRIKTMIDKKEAMNIVNTFMDKKRKEAFEIQNVEAVHIPFHILRVEMRIKRAFGLKPKIIEHLYWVNSIDGEVIRTKEDPETEQIQEGKQMNPRLSRKQCFQIAEEQGFKHVTRFYKSFWTPEIQVEEKEHVAIGYWQCDLKLEKNEKPLTLLINRFSGDVVQHQEDNRQTVFSNRTNQTDQMQGTGTL